MDIMKLTKNIIALQKGFICIQNNDNNNMLEASTIQSHLMQLGYMLDEDAFAQLKKASVSSMFQLHDELIGYIKDTLGDTLDYQPIYKNFPEEVMSMNDAELYTNAFLHYLSNGDWSPESVPFSRPIKLEKLKFTIIKSGNNTKFNQIFTDLVSLNTSLTPQDMSVVEWFVKDNRELIFPDTIPFKENLCTLAALGIKGLPIKTTTDVIRICVHLSGGDISLPKVPKQRKYLSKTSTSKFVYSTATTEKTTVDSRELFKFKKFTRKERRYILGLLEQTNCSITEMVLQKNRWIRLGEILHPGEYSKQFPMVATAFKLLRNEKVPSWYSLLEDRFEKSFITGLEFLSSRPGEYARRLDSLLRNNPDQKPAVLNLFGICADKISNKVIFELLNHFEGRKTINSNRSIMVKGKRTPTKLPILDVMSESEVDRVKMTLIDVLTDKFATLESLGNCWVDEELKKIPLPKNMRSMSFTSKPLIRGQRIKFDNPNTKVIRTFVHWMDEKGREDLDLSATFVGLGGIQVLNYHGLKVGNSVHSGDVRHRVGPCAEYVDIDIEDSLKNGFKYVSIDVRNFNGGSLESVGSVCGFMEREYPESNDIWLPETITNTTKLTSEGSNTVMCVIDLTTREYIMVDADSDGSVNAFHDIGKTLEMINSYIKLPKFSVYDLVMLHVNARGTHMLDDNECVTTRFTMDDFIHSYEVTGKLMGI